MISLLGKLLKLLPVLGVTIVLAAIGLSIHSGQMAQRELAMTGLGFALLLVVFLKAEASSLRYYLNLIVLSVLMLANLALVYKIIENHPQRWDLTSGARRSLAPQTIKVLSNLNKPVHLEAMALRNEPFRTYLARFAIISDRISYEVSNPFNLARMENPTGEEITMNQVRVSTGSGAQRKERVISFDAESDFDKIERDLEKEILNAVISLIQDRSIRLYFTSRHGEKSPQTLSGEAAEFQSISRFADYLFERSIIPRIFDLSSDRLVPDDCDLLVIAGPQIDFSENEVEAVRQYLEGGGSLLAFFDPSIVSRQNPARLRALLADYGLNVSGNILVDYGSSASEGNYFAPLIREYNPLHPITEKLQAYASDMPLSECTTVEKTSNPPADMQLTELIQSSEKSWTLTPEEYIDVARRGKMTLASAETWKQRTIALAAAPDPSKARRPRPKIVVFGDSDFITNAQLGEIQAILTYFSITWLTGKTDLIAIPPRAIEETPMALNAQQRNLVSILSVVILPFGVFFAGVGYTTMRRRKR